jgi:4-hydroxybenzoate polyprenyltransferase
VLDPAVTAKVDQQRSTSRIRSVALFIRASALGGTLVLPLVGAGSVGATPGPGELAGLLAVGLGFHVFAYVLNDVVDLPLDRTEPRRAEFPLVVGSVAPPVGLAVALGALAVALAIAAALDPHPRSLALLVVACAAMAAYDVSGKRLQMPPVTDLVQGIGWAGLLGWVLWRLDPA